jgi:hypothetical protein
MIYNWMDDGKTTLRGDWWHVALVRARRCFVRRVRFGDEMHWAFGRAWVEYDRMCCVTAVIPLNMLMRMGYACWWFAKKAPPAETMRELSERLEAKERRRA